MNRSTSAALLTSLFALACAGCSGSDDTGGADAGLPEFDAASPDLCGFTPGEPAWVVEGEPLTVTIACSSGELLDDLVMGPLPEGASYDAASRTITWTPALDQAAVYDIALSSNALRATHTLQIGVADALENPGNVPIVDPSKYTMELGLPVIFIEREPGGNTDYEAMQVTYGGKVHEAQAKLRGKSSLSYPKKSYALRFDKFDTFAETEFADFPNRTRVVLTSAFDDNSYIRQRLAFALWAKLEPSIAVTAYSAVVYRGTEYRGIYTVSDQVNADLMARSSLSDAGNVYKAENHDANFKTTANNGSAKDTLHQGYSKVEGDPKQGEPGAFDDMEALVDFVANSDDATFNEGISELVNVDEYAAWWMHATFTLAYDSAGKNSYHYHDNARTWRVTPWDFNSSFGQSWETERTDAQDIEFFYSRNRLFERLLAHPTLGPAIRQRYEETLESGVFSKAAVDEMVAAYAQELQLSAARDWARWESEYRSFDRWSWRTDFTRETEELTYVRDWIDERRQFVLDTYINP